MNQEMHISAHLPAALAFLVLLATGLHVSGAAAAGFETQFGCGTKESSRMKKVPLASMNIKQSLHVIHDSGKFQRVDLSRQLWTSISDHGFSNGAPTWVPSPNGRWTSYSGTRDGNSSSQYWLYDRQTNKDRLVFEHPAWGGGIPAFSPDSKFLVIAANYDSRWGNDAGAGIFLLDTATSRRVSVKLPTSIALKDIYASPEWSKDGSELLIMVRSMAEMSRFEYFSYRPSTKAIEKISGRYDEKNHQHIFSRRGRDIPAFAQLRPRSDYGLDSATSPDGKSRAFLERASGSMTYPLKVVDPNAVTRTVAHGQYENCGGNTIYITGWLDDQHLVYRERLMNYRVFEISTGNSADLFTEKEMVRGFTW